jgi:hypothetical protein
MYASQWIYDVMRTSSTNVCDSVFGRRSARFCDAAVLLSSAHLL